MGMLKKTGLLGAAVGMLGGLVPYVAGADAAPAPVPAPVTLAVESLPATAEVQREEQAVAALEGITVTATRVATPEQDVPASIALISGRELRRRGVSDLQSALLLVAGAASFSGGDAGPAGSQPILRGSSETDDYLLVVDGIPLGGAFNPATAQLDFNNIAKIEVLRGPSPVLFGAISFVGVVSVEHYAAGEADDHLDGTLGTHGSGGLRVAKALPAVGAWRQSLSAEGERVGTSDPAGYADKLHGLYRAATPWAGGLLRLDLDSRYVRQKPNSPALFSESGPQLTRIDANFNPLDARLSDTHFQLSLVYTHPFRFGEVQWTLSGTDALAHHRRGVLKLAENDDAETASANPSAAEQLTEALTEAYNEALAPALNALVGAPAGSGLMGAGYAQRRHITDGYSDLHLASRLAEGVQLVSGVDALYGDAQQRTDGFDYTLAADGTRPNTAGTPSNSVTQLGVTRRYAGLYSQVQWRLLPHGTLTAGLRLNRTVETRRVDSLVVTPPQTDDAFDTTQARLGLAQGTITQAASRDSRGATRVSGLIGLNQRLWHDAGGGDEVTGYLSYRNTYKPADVDFGAEARSTILAPQTGQSVELGFKGRGLDKTLQFDADVFLSRVKNVVIEDEASGTLTNAGEEGVSGAELEARYLVAPYASLFTDYTYTHARYRRLVLGGTDYAGKRLEFIPEHEGALGLLYSQPSGPLAAITAKVTGDRRLDRANAVPLGAFVTLDANLGWNARGYTLQLTGQNLTDRRVPVGRTEFGEDQFYLLNGRQLRLQLRAPF